MFFEFLVVFIFIEKDRSGWLGKMFFKFIEYILSVYVRED